MDGTLKKIKLLKGHYINQKPGKFGSTLLVLRNHICLGTRAEGFKSSNSMEPVEYNSNLLSVHEPVKYGSNLLKNSGTLGEWTNSNKHSGTLGNGPILINTQEPGQYGSILFNI